MANILYKSTNYNIPIIFEDNHLIIVKKPVGMLSQADKTGDVDLLNIIKEYIRVKYEKPGAAWLGLVHRLDRPVGGLMAFAKTSKAASRLSDQIRKNTFVRKYLAVVHGHLQPKNGIWDEHISKKKIKGKYVVNTNLDPKYLNKYQACSLNYQVQAYLPKQNLSLVEIELKTGRSHQIRAQMKAHDHPLIGDRLYGKLTHLDRKANGPALYASFLQFKHPVKDEILIYKSSSEDFPFTLFE
ncbi:MAG: RluA family pseudouridine synthase [Clostridiaceae bacterium]|nr:RluA family pseudouridine synthase [Clostridiaceae bacterium]